MEEVIISRAILEEGVMKPIFLNSFKEGMLKIGADILVLGLCGVLQLGIEYRGLNPGGLFSIEACFRLI